MVASLRPAGSRATGRRRLAAVTGRFAPSPTGPLHVGNLRTALLAWLVARSAGERFVVRMEDLDRVQRRRRAHEARQLADLAAIGLDWDGPVVRQSERFDRYDAAIAGAAARRARLRVLLHPPGDPRGGRAPRTVRSAPTRGRAATCRRRSGRRAGAERPPALRLRSPGEPVTFDDALAGPLTGVPDDVVLRRNDGVPAYNLAVVVDDAAQGVDDVVRGDDLLASTPRQVAAAAAARPARRRATSTSRSSSAPTAQRLAKRHGAVTLEDLAAEGVTGRPRAASLGCRRRLGDRSTTSTWRASPPSVGRRSRSPTCNDPGRDGGRRPRPGARLPRRRRRARRACTELGPDLLVVPFWTPRVLRGDRAGRRSRRLRRRPRRPGARATRCRWPRSARASTSSCRTTSAGASGRSCRRCGRSSTTTACATPSSSATRSASRSRCASTTTSPRCRRRSSSTTTTTAPSCASRARASTTPTCPVGALLAWPSLVTHPHEVAPLRRGVKHGLTIWFELPFAAST